MTQKEDSVVEALQNQRILSMFLKERSQINLLIYVSVFKSLSSKCKLLLFTNWTFGYGKHSPMLMQAKMQDLCIKQLLKRLSSVLVIL